MHTIRKIYDLFFDIIKYLCVAIMLIMTLIVGYNVFMRYVMHNTPRWGDEMAIFCMIWFSLLSASWAFKENRHIRIEFWGSVLPPKVYKAMELLITVIALGAFIVMLKFSTDMLSLVQKTKLSGSGLPMITLYIAEPISAFCMAIAAIGRIGEIIGRKC